MAKNTVLELCKKPSAIIDYNNRKWPVDCVDQMVCHFSCNRKTNRWPVKLFFNLLDIAYLNAMIIFKQFHKMPDKPNFRSSFFFELCEQLVKPHTLSSLKVLTLNVSFKKNIELFFKVPEVDIQLAEVENGDAKNRGRCYICPTRKQSRTKCETCNRHVCPQHYKTICNNCS